VQGESVDRPLCGVLTEHGGPCPRSKGGKLRSIVGRRSKLASAEQVLTFNADVVHRVMSGELAVDVARCAIYGLSLQRQLIESSDLEQRLAALEAMAGQQRRVR
jgi:hypothetical protein